MGNRGWNEVMWVVEVGMKLCGLEVMCTATDRFTVE